MNYDTEKKAFIDAGHALITEGLAAAHAAGDANPRMPLKTVVMSIEQTLRGFFNHLMSIGEDAAGAALDAGAQKLEDDLAQDPLPPVATDNVTTDAIAAEIAKQSAKPLDPETVGAAPAKDPTLKVQG